MYWAAWHLKYQPTSRQNIWTNLSNPIDLTIWSDFFSSWSDSVGMVTAESASDYCPACGAQLDPILGSYRLNVATFEVTLDCLGTEDGRASHVEKNFRFPLLSARMAYGSFFSLPGTSRRGRGGSQISMWAMKSYRSFLWWFQWKHLVILQIH